VAGAGCRVGRIEQQRDTAFLSRGFHEIDGVTAQCAQVQQAEFAAQQPRLDAGNAQQGLECGQHLVDVGEIVFQPHRQFGGGRRMCKRRLDARAVAGQWRAQVVRDVVGGAAHGCNQPVDAVEHAVQGLRQAVEFVSGAAHRNAMPQVAIHDLLRRAPHRFDRPQRGARDQIAAAEGDQQHEAETRQRRTAYVLAYLFDFVFVEAHEQPAAVGQMHPARNDVGIAGMPQAGQAQRCLVPLAATGHVSRLPISFCPSAASSR
jgi:hypothetical protein